MNQTQFDFCLSNAWRLQTSSTEGGEVIEGELTALNGEKQVQIRGGIQRFVESSNYDSNFDLSGKPSAPHSWIATLVSPRVSTVLEQH